MKDIVFSVYCHMHCLMAIQNILQNSSIFNNRSRETVPSVMKKVTQFSGFLPTSVSYLNRLNLQRMKWKYYGSSCILFLLGQESCKLLDNFHQVLNLIEVVLAATLAFLLFLILPRQCKLP